MSTHTLAFAPASSSNVYYSLLELPPELLSLVEQQVDTPFVIKGQADDDAVLCTTSRTHALRACVNSNSLLLCHAVAPEWDEDDTRPSLRVDATLHQTLECVPTRPRIEKVDDLLGPSEWSGERDNRPSKRIRLYSRDEVARVVQASDEELDAALDAQRILEIDGMMRKIDRKALAAYLSSLLHSFVGNALNPDAFSFDAALAIYASEADVVPGTARKIVDWFSNPTEHASEHALDLSAIAKEIGLALLENWRSMVAKPDGARTNRISPTAFDATWREQMTETFATHCSRHLLTGHMIYNELPEPHYISVPPHSLPLDPAGRFAHLFSLKPRWLPEDMIPFLDPISLDVKERERWVLKYARKVKVPGGKGGGMVWVSRSAAA